MKLFYKPPERYLGKVDFNVRVTTSTNPDVGTPKQPADTGAAGLPVSISIILLYYFIRQMFTVPGRSCSL